MIYLITGVPGSGKTLYTISQLEKMLDSGRPIYHNINGYKAGLPLPDSLDWRDTPENSVIVYDEAQQHFPGRSPNKSVPEILSALETHRHKGYDLFFITQYPTFIDHHIRQLCGKHSHLDRKSGAQAAIVRTSDKAWDVKDKLEKSQADKIRWTYPKKLFEKYDSATQHTHKFKMPSKMKLAIVIGISAIAILIFAGSRISDFFDGTRLDEMASNLEESQGIVEKTKNTLQNSLKVLTGADVPSCISTKKYCRCFNSDGIALDIERYDCLMNLELLPASLPTFAKSKN